MTTKNLNIRVKTTGVQKAETQMKRLGSSVSSTIAQFAGFAAVSALLIKVGKDLINLTSKAQGVTAAFKALNSKNLLKDLREATRGTVGDLELMVNAVQAKNLGVGIEQLATLFKFASIRARETGESVDFLVQSIVTGIGRKSVLILDNLGLSAVKIQEEFKKTGDFAEAVGRIVREDLANMDDSISPVADAVDRASAAVDNFQLKMSEAFVTMFDGLEDTSEILEKITGLLNFGLAMWSDWDFTIAGVTRKTIAFLTAANAEVQKPGGMWDEQAWKERKRAILDAQTALGGEENKDPATAAREYATAMAEVGEATMKSAKAFEHLATETARADKFLIHIQTTAERYQQGLGTMLSSFDQFFTEVLIREQNFGDAFVAQFINTLERLVAAMAARAAVFSVFSFFGSILNIGTPFTGINPLDFITGPITGVSPSVGSRGSSTTNINMPNVTMINSRSIGQIKQALSLHDRRH